MIACTHAACVYVTVFAITGCVYICKQRLCTHTIILLLALLYKFIRHYWYLPVKMRYFQRAALRSNLTDPQNITKDGRPQGRTKGEEDQIKKKKKRALGTTEEKVKRRI